MSIRRTLAMVGLAMLTVVSMLAVYFWTLSPPEKWLLLCASDAESYAQNGLSGRMPDKWPPADCLIDVYIATKPKDRTVLFSPHDDHETGVIYAPDRSSEKIIYERRDAHRIRKNWYVLF